ncbi:MAG: YceI family protein [Burkholderiaceae bacterium]
MKNLLSSLAISIGVAVAVLQPVAAVAEPFQAVDVDRSQVTFNVQQMGVGTEGSFKRFDASFTFDPERPDQAKGRFDIDLTSIDTGLSEADQEVQGELWFDTARHPKASFVLDGLQATGPRRYEARGQLTIKGRTQEVRAPFELTPDAVMKGSFAMKRSDFAIGEGMWASFDVVANEITVRFTLKLN